MRGARGRGGFLSAYGVVIGQGHQEPFGARGQRGLSGRFAKSSLVAGWPIVDRNSRCHSAAHRVFVAAPRIDPQKRIAREQQSPRKLGCSPR